MRTIGLLLVSLLFVAAGALILLRGEADARPIALACIVFFGACAMVFAFQMLPKRALTIEPDGAVIVRGSRAQFIVFAICAAAFAAACPTLGALAAAERAWIDSAVTWFGTAFFGAGAIYLAWRALEAGDLWRLDAEGVESLAGVKWRLPWTAITALTPFEIRGQRFVGFTVAEGFVGRPTLKGRLASAFNVPEFAIGPQGSNAAFEDLAAHVERFWRAAQTRRA